MENAQRPFLNAYSISPACCRPVGLVGPVSKFALKEGISGLEVAFWCSFTAGIFFLMHAFAGKRTVRVDRADWTALLLFSVFGVALLEGSNLLAVEIGERPLQLCCFTARRYG